MHLAGISLPYPKRILVLSILVFLTLATLAVTLTDAQAMNATQSSNGSGLNRVQPYTSGAPISKVFYPSDGSTVTVTSTGAVIKQSPGHTPYREGWVNTANINGLNSAADLRGQLASGNKNPYTNNSSNNQSSSHTSSSTATSQTPSASSTSNATANANVMLAGSGTTSTPYSQSSSGQTSSGSSNTSAQYQNNNTLPNTGPGNVIAISATATILGTVGHLIFQRLRYRSLV